LKLPWRVNWYWWSLKWKILNCYHSLHFRGSLVCIFEKYFPLQLEGIHTLIYTHTYDCCRYLL
jgi:hypothetical protein